MRRAFDLLIGYRPSDWTWTDLPSPSVFSIGAQPAEIARARMAAFSPKRRREAIHTVVRSPRCTSSNCWDLPATRWLYSRLLYRLS